MAPQIGRALLLGLVAFSGVAGAQTAEPSTTEFTLSERWSHYLHRTYGPARIGSLAVETALDQMQREPHCWDMSAGSYLQRYGRAFDRRMIRNTVELGAGIVTGEDLRYRTLGSGSMPRRVWHAARSAVSARMPDGRDRPAYTRLLASAVTEFSTTHWIGQRIKPEWAFRAVGSSLLDQVQTNLLDEFGPDIRGVAKRIWKGARGK